METQGKTIIPLEIIRKIIKLVPKRYWRNIAISCRCFYEIICDLEKFEHPLYINENSVSQKKS